MCIPANIQCNFNWHWWQIKCGTRQQLQVCVFFFDHWVVGIELVTDDAKLHLEFTLAVATSKWISAFKPHHLLNAQKFWNSVLFHKSQINWKIVPGSETEGDRLPWVGHQPGSAFRWGRLLLSGFKGYFQIKSGFKGFFKWNQFWRGYFQTKLSIIIDCLRLITWELCRRWPTSCRWRSQRMKICDTWNQACLETREASSLISLISGRVCGINRNRQNIK